MLRLFVGRRPTTLFASEQRSTTHIISRSWCKCSVARPSLQLSTLPLCRRQSSSSSSSSSSSLSSSSDDDAPATKRLFTDIDSQSWVRYSRPHLGQRALCFRHCCMRRCCVRQVQRYLPIASWPYASLGRWDRPIGTWLLLWPCLWSTALASPPGALPDASLCLLFGVGAFAMRGAGCTINDLWDRDIDRQVERTRSRPRASGVLGVPQALSFLAAQCGLGLGVLLALPPYAVGLSFMSMPLVALYPLAKRVMP